MENINEEAQATVAESTGEPVKSPKANRMSGEQWTDCKIKWASGQHTLEELSKMYGVSKNAVFKRLKRHGIKKGSDAQAYEAANRTKQIEDAAEAAAERDARIREKARETEEFILNGVEAIARQGLKAIADARKNTGSIGAAVDDVKVAKEAVQMFKASVETIKKVVGEDNYDEDELPILSVEGLTQEDMDEIRREQEETEALFGESVEETADILDDLDED